MHPLDTLDHLLAKRGPAAVRTPIHVEAASASLGNLAEFAAIRWAWWVHHCADLLDVLPPSDLPVALPEVGDGAALLVPTGTTCVGEIHEVPALGPGWRAGEPFFQFQERFKQRLAASAVPSKFAHALAGALNEMASNAAEHSLSPLPPVATYEVTENRWSFSVTDVGCGLLESLCRNPRIGTIPTETEALRLAVSDGISGTGEPGRGHGFEPVFKALVDRQCALRFRSTAALGHWEGATPAADRLRLMPCPRRGGFHVQVSGTVRSERPEP